MMLGNTIFIIATIIFVIATGIFIGFVFSEGKDERGQQILGKSFNVAFIFLLVGFVVQNLLFRYGNVDLEFMKVYVTAWIAIVMASNTITITVLKRRV